MTVDIWFRICQWGFIIFGSISAVMTLIDFRHSAKQNFKKKAQRDIKKLRKKQNRMIQREGRRK